MKYITFIIFLFVSIGSTKSSDEFSKIGELKQGKVELSLTNREIFDCFSKALSIPINNKSVRVESGEIRHFIIIENSIDNYSLSIAVPLTIIDSSLCIASDSINTYFCESIKCSACGIFIDIETNELAQKCSGEPSDESKCNFSYLVRSDVSYGLRQDKGIFDTSKFYDYLTRGLPKIFRKKIIPAY
jgi:hypothetical protein